jgi:hypothetical protein
VNAVNRIYQQLSQFIDKQFVNNNCVVCVSLKIFRDIRCEIFPNKVRCNHEFDYHRLSKYESKKPLHTWALIRDSGFLAFIKSLISLSSCPENKIYPKAVANVGSNYKQRFFDVWRNLMSLRTPSNECEAKDRCRVGTNYEQRFFAVHGYLVN